MQKKILTVAALLSITTLYAADESNNGRVREGYRPKGNDSVPTMTMRDVSPISEQILKEEIRTYTLPVIQQRMLEAIGKTGPQIEGRRCPIITYLLIKRTFNNSSTDPLTKTIFDIVSKKESKEDSVLADNNSGYIVGLETPRELDIFTVYKKISNPDNTFTIECTTRLKSKSYIEEIIADMTQNS